MRKLVSFLVLAFVLLYFLDSCCSASTKWCNSNSDCIFTPCRDEKETRLCVFLDTKHNGRCRCITDEENRQSWSRFCSRNCKGHDNFTQTLVNYSLQQIHTNNFTQEPVICPSDRKSVCDDIFRWSNEPRKTLKCKCIPKECKSNLDCEHCIHPEKEVCVNGICSCEMCSGPCHVNPNRTCPRSSERAFGCPSGQCLCRMQECKMHSDCSTAKCAPEEKRLCTTRYSHVQVCSICLKRDACSGHEECSKPKCCVYKRGDEGGGYGYCTGTVGCKSLANDDAPILRLRD